MFIAHPLPPCTLCRVPYCFHHHSFIIRHQWLIFPFPRFQSWAMDPSFWIGSMDHLYGPGQWTHGPPVMDRVHVPLKRKKIKTEKWTINKMQINIVQQYYSFNDKLRDKFWVSQSFWFVTWTQNMDPGSMDPPTLNRVHGNFLFKELKVEMINKHYGRLQPTKILQNTVWRCW